MEKIRKRAIRFLSQRADLEPPYKIHLAKKYDIDEWIGPAFFSLMDTNLVNFTLGDIDVMGTDIYQAIIHTTLCLFNEKLHVAYHCPAAQRAEGCKRHDLCAAEWEGTWRNGFCKYLLHPERPLSPNTALVKLESSNFKVMSRNCQCVTIEYIRKSSVLNYRDRIIQDTVDELLNDLRSRRSGRIVGPEPSQESGEHFATADTPLEEEAGDIDN